MGQVLDYISAALFATAAFFVVGYAGASWRRLVHTAEERPARGEERSSVARALVRFWSRRLAPMLPVKLSDDISQQITRAGGLDGSSPGQIVLYAIFTSILGLTLGVLIVVVTGWSPSLVIAVTVTGSIFPFLWLRDQVKRRHQEILSDLPYHLDILTLSVEAGLDFGAAVSRVVDKGRPGALREELNAFLGEIRIGKTRAEALESMAERVGLEQLSGFLAALIQADRMGSGLGKALRIQSEQLRIERFQRAEKLAGEAPVKMLIPLVIFIFPTIWIILGAPLVFEWIFKP